MKVLGKLNLRNILYVGVLGALFTILLCYVLAISLHHEPVWLPTISECGVESPEKYFFRWGILACGLLLCLEAVMLWWPKRISTVVFVLAVIAGIALTLVAVVAVNENPTVHLIFALGFFTIENVVVVLMICGGLVSTSRRALAVRIPSAVITTAATLARYLVTFSIVNIPNNDVPWVAIIEWINVFAMLAFHLSLSDDLDDLYLAELEDDEKANWTSTKLELQIKSDF